MGGNSPYGGFGGMGGMQGVPPGVFAEIQQQGEFTRGWSLGLGPNVRGVVEMLRGAGRGLLVVGELGSPEEGVAAIQISNLLGWPMVTDILSGLRVGLVESDSSSSSSSSRGGSSSGSSSSSSGGVYVHHMDHLLLGGADWWSELQPDVVLQLGRHITSKRLGQFMVSL